MKDKISSLQIGAITWCLMLSSYIGILPYILFFKLKQDSWLAVISTFIGGFIVIVLYLYIWNKKPEFNIFEKIEYVFGTFIGKIINFIITSISLYMVLIYLFSMINFISSQYLDRTPKLLIIIIFIIPTVYLIIQKLEVIGRVTFVFWIMSFFLFLLTLIGLLFQIDLAKIFPILENGILPIFNTSYICLPFTNFALFLLLSIPKSSIIDKEKLNKRVIIFYIITFLVIFIGIFFIITTLGGELAKIYQYPEFQVLKKVSLIGFIERIENTLSIRWIFYMFITAIIGLYFIKKFIIHTFKVEKYERWIITIIAILALISSNWLFPSNTFVNKVILNFIPPILYICFLILPIIIAIGLKIKN